MIYFVPEGREAVRRAGAEQPRRLLRLARGGARPRLRRAGHRDLLQLPPRLSYGRRCPPPGTWRRPSRCWPRGTRRPARPCAGRASTSSPSWTRSSRWPAAPPRRPANTRRAARCSPRTPRWPGRTTRCSSCGTRRRCCASSGGRARRTLLTEGVGPLDALVLHAATGEVPSTSSSVSRAWPEPEWAAAGERLRERGLLDGDSLSAEGRRLRQHIEDRTDALALPAYSGSGRGGLRTSRRTGPPLRPRLVDAGLLKPG